MKKKRLKLKIKLQCRKIRKLQKIATKYQMLAHSILNQFYLGNLATIANLLFHKQIPKNPTKTYYKRKLRKKPASILQG